MPEIKNTFQSGIMNKDLDERLVPNGQYRDAMNIQVATSEDSEVGTVQNILGNARFENVIDGVDFKCVGAIADEKNNTLYWFVTSPTVDAIIEYHDNTTVIPILVDTNVGTPDAVLKFDRNNLITGINIIDNLLFWTDNINEPKKINIDTFKLNFTINNYSDLNTHSDMFVNDASIGLVTEDHITVIRKRPQRAPSIVFSKVTLQDILELENINFHGLTTLSPTVNSIFLPSTSPTAPYIVNDILLLSETTSTGTLPQNYKIKIKVANIGPITGGYEIDFDILEISGNYADIDLNYNCIKEIDEKPIFEKEFIRFATRYKYADGEYSAFSPFTTPVFLAGRFGFHPTKDPYNLGMENNSISIRLQDLVTTDTPSDVVQIDILFKKERSTTIYSINSIKQNDPLSANYWNMNQYNTKTILNSAYPAPFTDSTTTYHTNYTYEYSGEYEITVENIYAALPDNQMLRPWDNVPRKALAQEITGNRLIYGNYLQNYNLKDYNGDICKPQISISYNERKDYTNSQVDFSSGGKKSLKSLRTYYAGVVYGDKYGRETPVFTNKDAAIKIPYDQDDSNNFDGTADKSFVFECQLFGEIPDFAHYYKYFIKQTTGEYYNLTMDRVYRADGDDNLWISFPSSDRNKIQEGDYFSIKKQVDIETMIPVENKIKIIDIKNEAPESIKYEFSSLGTGAGDAANLAALFPDPNRRPASGVKTILINQDEWTNVENGLDLEEATTKSDKIAIQFSISISGNILKSQKYIASAWALEEITANSYNYNIQLKNLIADEDAWVESSPGVLNADQGFSVTIYKVIEKNASEFEGRFFVKIISNPVTQEYLVPSISDVTNFATVGRLDTFNFADVVNQSSTGAGLVNSYNSTFGSNLTGNSQTSTYNQWNTLDNTIETNFGSDRYWFVDAAHFIAGQSSNSTDVKDSGKIFKGNPSVPAQRVVGNEGVIAFTGAPSSGYHPGGSRQWNVQEINPTLTAFNTTAGGGANLTAPSWTYVSSGTYDSSYDTSNPNPVYLHLSYTGVGVDLHDGDFSAFENKIDGLTTSNPLIGPHGVIDEIFDKALDRIQASNIILPEVYGVAWPSGNIYYGGTPAFVTNFAGVKDSSSYGDTSHWKLLDSAHYTPQYNNADGVAAFDIGYNNPSAALMDAKLQPGSKFMIEGDNSTVYTILDVHKHYLYNHTSWNPVQRHDTSGNIIYPNSFTAAQFSVSSAMTRFLDDFGATYGSWPDSNDQTFTNLCQTIQNFGRANNRRISYVLELDKDPRTAGTVDILSATKSSDLQLRFVESYIEPGSNTLPSSPAIFETEAKEETDLNIYYEASDAIPVKIGTDQDSLEGHLLGPVGSRVTCVSNTSANALALQQDTYPEFDFFPRVANWEGNTVEINNPGFRDVNEPFTYGDQLGSFQNKLIKFWKNDGSFNGGKIVDIEIPTGSQFITKITIVPETSSNRSSLPYYNCFSFGNGVESNRIRDDFNESFILNGVKASTVLEEPYEEERRKYGLIYSGLYNSTSGVNNLNQFIQAEKITKDIMPSYGSIQKLYARDKDLVTLCEDKILQIFVDKDILYNADGNQNLLSTNRVLGEASPFRGNFGISKNPESFAAESFRAYFTDKQRGAVLRLSIDGLTPISDAGMHDYFRDHLKDGGRIYGSYDSYKEDYNLTISFEDGEDNVRNPEFNEGFTTQTTLGSEILDNNSFANFATSYTSNQLGNGNFGTGIIGWSRVYGSSGTMTASIGYDSANAPAMYQSRNINGTIDSTTYVNPNNNDGSASMFFSANSALNANSVLSSADSIFQIVNLSTALIVGMDAQLEWEVFDANGGGGGWFPPPFGSFVGMKIEVQDKDGNGFFITKSDIKLGQLGGFSQKRYHKFTKTIQQGVFNQLGSLAAGQWMVRFYLIGTESDWDGKSFKMDNFSFKVASTDTDDWTANTEAYNNNGTMEFSDFGLIEQNNMTGVESGKLYRVKTVVSGFTGQPWYTINGVNCNFSDDDPISYQGIIQADVHFPQTTNDILVGVSGGTLEVNSISIKPIENYGGNVDHWDLNGGNNTANIYTFQPLFSNNKKIVFDEAPSGTYLHQDLIPTNKILDFDNGTRVTVKFYLSNYTGMGDLEFRLFNSDGEGFKHVVDTSVDGWKTFTGTIGNTTSNVIFSKFGFYSGSSSNDLSCEIDSVSIVINGHGQGITLSYNEKSKGWVSFKSFVPEFAISSVNQYYTMNLGQLWKHHLEFEQDFATPVNRNTFYGVHEDSSVTPILNKLPELVKHFNTINYEGTQSKIDAHIGAQAVALGVNPDNNYYNLENKLGWYVEGIKTNKQNGTVNEFIEKEGKWFNYIKGIESQKDLSAFNLQGLGIVDNIEVL